MKYLSRGCLRTEGSRRYIARGGRVFSLGPSLYALWEAGRGKPQEVPAESEAAIRRMAEAGIIALSAESGTLADYQLLCRCILCPDNRQSVRLLCLGIDQRLWKWINEAGLRLTASELVRLEEQHLRPERSLLGGDSRQELTELIYDPGTIPDGVLNARMELSPARDATVASLLRLLRGGRLLLI